MMILITQGEMNLISFEEINNPELFAKKAKYFTRIYASLNVYNKTFSNISNGWDFTYKE